MLANIHSAGMMNRPRRSTAFPLTMPWTPTMRFILAAVLAVLALMFASIVR